MNIKLFVSACLLGGITMSESAAQATVRTIPVQFATFATISGSEGEYGIYGKRWEVPLVSGTDYAGTAVTNIYVDIYGPTYSIKACRRDYDGSSATCNSPTTGTGSGAQDISVAPGAAFAGADHYDYLYVYVKVPV